jgi:hypothetical protein
MSGAANLRPFQPGQSGNPKGRAQGSRNKLGEAFLDALLDDWQQHGAGVIAKVREEKPDQYLKVVASILPRELNVAVSPFEGMSDDELEAGDVRMLKDVLTTAAQEAINGQEWTVLNTDNPMQSIAQLAAYVGTLNVQLMAQGFQPPTIDYEVDPLGFLEENAEFFGKIEGQVVDLPVTRH